MHPLLQNRFVRFAGTGLLILIAIFIIFAVIVGSLNDARTGGSYSNQTVGMNAPTVSMGSMAQTDRAPEMYESEDYYSASMPDTPYPLPNPSPTPIENYTSNLERYETTQYNVKARTKQFDELCNAVKQLKADNEINFKQITESLNNCQANFFVSKNKTEAVLATLNSYSGVEINLNTESVTRYRSQLQSQTNILQQQLSSIERSLNAAETQFSEIAELAKNQKDVATLSQTIREKINMVEMLTQQKINLTNQLDNIYRQSAELEERIDVVEFYVNVNRSYPIFLNKDSKKWETAKENLKDTFTDTMIGLTTTFVTFLLWILRLSIYLLVVLIVVRGVWKFINVIWKY